MYLWKILKILERSLKSISLSEMSRQISQRIIYFYFSVLKLCVIVSNIYFLLFYYKFWVETAKVIFFYASFHVQFQPFELEIDPELIPSDPEADGF